MKWYLVQQGFDESARKYGEKIALYYNKEKISFNELYKSSNQLAHSLQRNGITRGHRVVVILPKSIELIRAILGVLKADAIYVPIDPNAPCQRIQEILSDCSASGIICDNSILGKIGYAKLKEELHLKIWLVGDITDDESCGEFNSDDKIRRESCEVRKYDNIDRDIAYIIYTSGSTGKPKGVMISHSNIRNYINWALKKFNITKDDNIFNTAHFYYDMSTFDLYCSLISGASLTIAPEKSLLFPNELIKLIEKRNITIWKCVSFLLGYFVKMNALNTNRMGGLKKLIFSGESIHVKYLIDWMKTFPQIEFYNAYGPTECTGITVCYKIRKVPADRETKIPIGTPCENTELICLVDGSAVAKPSEVGELYIKGASVGCGYWNDSEKTDKYFIQNPLNKTYKDVVYRTGDYVKKLNDGNYIFMGRKDSQVKITGHRIELGEIEYILNGLDHVKDAAVILANGDNENKIIMAFIEIDNHEKFEVIMRNMKKKLPKFMIPGIVKPVDKIKRMESGKIDKHYLNSIYRN